MNPRDPRSAQARLGRAEYQIALAEYFRNLPGQHVSTASSRAVRAAHRNEAHAVAFRAAWTALAALQPPDSGNAPLAAAAEPAAGDASCGDGDTFHRRPYGHRGPWSPLQHYEAELRETILGARSMPGAALRAFSLAAWRPPNRVDLTCAAPVGRVPPAPISPAVNRQ